MEGLTMAARSSVLIEKVGNACDTGPFIYVTCSGLHGLDHPGRGDGDTGAEPCQRHPGKCNHLCMLTNTYKAGALTNIFVGVNIHKYCTAVYIISATVCRWAEGLHNCTVIAWCVFTKTKIYMRFTVEEAKSFGRGVHASHIRQCNSKGCLHRVHIYHSVCPLVGIGTLPYPVTLPPQPPTLMLCFHQLLHIHTDRHIVINISFQRSQISFRLNEQRSTCALTVIMESCDWHNFCYIVELSRTM